MARVRAATVAWVAVLAVIRGWFPPVSFVLPLAVPAGFAGWFAGSMSGGLVAALGPVLLWAVDALRGVAPDSPGLAAWQVGSEIVVLFGISWVFSHYRGRLREEARTAATDPLTHLPNRGAFIGRLDEEIARAGRYGYAFTLAYVDLDGFKAVNDRHGHDEGDTVLRRVADELRSGTRQTDHLGRLGGDEFAMLLPHTTVGPALSVLQKLQHNLDLAMDGGGWPVTFSIGAVTFEAPIDDHRRALQLADQAMYTVKHGSKDGIHHVVWDGDTALP